MSEHMQPPAQWELGGSLHGNYRYVGEGGEQIVYYDPYFEQLAQDFNDPYHRVVVKLNRYELLQRYASRDNTMSHTQRATAYAARRNERYEVLQQEFDSEAPWQASGVNHFWLPPNEMAYIWRDEPVPDVDGIIIAVTTLQNDIPEFASGMYENLHVAIAERSHANADLYPQVTHRWVTEPHELPTAQEQREFQRVQRSPLMRRMLRDYEPGAPLRDKLGQVAGKAIRYAQRSGEILDLARDNLLLMPSGRATLADALWPIDQRIVDELPSLVLKVQEYQGLTLSETRMLMNGLGFVRTINYVAALHDIPDRLELFKHATIRLQTWRHIFDIIASGHANNMLLGSTSAGVPISLAQ